MHQVSGCFVVLAVASMWVACTGCGRDSGISGEGGDGLPSNLVGRWVSVESELDATRVGYKSTLEIQEDGSFSKKQSDRIKSVEYLGTVAFVEGWLLEFRVKEIVRESSEMSMSDFFRLSPMKTKTSSEPVDETYHCDFSLDHGGRLELHLMGRSKSEQGIGIHFETYERQ